MQRLILDTNVIVSALIANSIPTRIVYEFVLCGKVELCLSTKIFEEYLEVLDRKKFERFPNFTIKAGIVVNKLREISRFYRDEMHVNLSPDSSDNKFLDLAAVSGADFLLTGNVKDFPMTDYEYTRILTPRDYWDENQFLYLQ